LPLSFGEGVGGEEIMTNLSFKQAANLLIFTLANLLIFFACSKSGDEPTAPTVVTPEHLNNWEPKPVVDATQNYMPFLTESTNTLTVSITRATATSTVWVDTNNNGVFDKDTDVLVSEPAQTVTFNAPNKVFTVYGSVSELNAAGNALTAADVRANPALTKLNVANNHLKEAALTNLINSFPTAPTADASVVLRSTEGESNEVTNKVREDLAKKGWKVLRLNKGAVEEDKEAPQPDPQKPDEPQKPVEDKTPPTLGNIKVTNATDNQVTVEWDKAKDDVTPQAELHYQLLLFQADGTTLIKDYGEMKAFSYTIKDLATDTQYVVKVKVTDKANNSNYYELKFQTEAKADKRPPFIGSLSVKATNFSTINVTWTAASDDVTPDNKLRYEVTWKRKDNQAANSFVVKDALHYDITNLQEKTTYFVNVKVTDEAGKSSFYSKEDISVTTPEDKADEGLDKVNHIELRANMGGSASRNVTLEIYRKWYGESVWIDIDGNNQWDKNIDVRVTEFGEKVTYTIKSNKFNIYGSVEALSCHNNDLTSIDFGKSNFLDRLYAIGNKDLSVKGTRALKHLTLDSSAFMRSTSLNVGSLEIFVIKETDPFPDGTINTSAMSSLQSLDIENCKSIKRLDLTNNRALISLRATNTRISLLSLKNLPNLKYLMVGGCPLYNIVLENCEALLDVDVSLDKEGFGLSDRLIFKTNNLTKFLKSLPDRKNKPRGGIVYLSKKQITNEIEKLVEEKGRVVIEVK
jgi:leucine rich repeat domain protein